jgi:hypothetical protein
MKLLIADLWGADGTSKIAMPGDDGDWSSYDDFLTALTDAANDNDMSAYLDLEIWNEPDLSDLFRHRDQMQYLAMWSRRYAKLRAKFPNNSIIGPCTSSQRSSSNIWLQNYLQYIKNSDTVPDIFGWYRETGGDDLEVTLPAWSSLLSQYGVPAKPIICNE